MPKRVRISRKPNRIVQPRIRGISGPIVQRISPKAVIHTPGNYIQPRT